MVVRMDITPYVDSLRRDLLAAAEAGGDEARQVAERLELRAGRQRPPGPDGGHLAGRRRDQHRAAPGRRGRAAQRPRARLRGRGRPDDVAPRSPAPPTPPRPEDVEEGDLARITLRIPESIKTRAEEKASDQRPEPQHVAGVGHPGRHLRPRDQRRHRPLEHPVLRPRPLQGRQPRQPPHDRLALTSPAPSVRHHERSSTQAGPRAEHTLETPMDHTFETPDPIELYVELRPGPHRRHRHRHRHHDGHRDRRPRRRGRRRATRRPGRRGRAPQHRLPHWRQPSLHRRRSRCPTAARSRSRPAAPTPGPSVSTAPRGPTPAAATSASSWSTGPLEVQAGSGDLSLRRAAAARAGSRAAPATSGSAASARLAHRLHRQRRRPRRVAWPASLAVKTGSGDVRVGESSDDVSFSTGSGDLQVGVARRGPLHRQGGERRRPPRHPRRHPRLDRHHHRHRHASTATSAAPASRPRARTTSRSAPQVATGDITLQQR